VSACSGHGFKFGIEIGRILAALAVGQEPGTDIGRFRLGRPALAGAWRNDVEGTAASPARPVNP